MEKKFNIIEKTGTILLILLMIPFILLLMAEPSMANDEPQTNLPVWVAYGWLGAMAFSVFLLIVGNVISKFTK